VPSSIFIAATVKEHNKETVVMKTTNHLRMGVDPVLKIPQKMGNVNIIVP
jgi:hypothetical protein